VHFILRKIIFYFVQIVPERIDSRARAPEQNVQPGTVVDRGVMNAALTEFLLVGHKALQVRQNGANSPSIYHSYSQNKTIDYYRVSTEYRKKPPIKYLGHSFGHISRRKQPIHEGDMPFESPKFPLKVANSNCFLKC
jgi:hypothetical protein